MDNGLVHYYNATESFLDTCLNPCCSGQWSSTRIDVKKNPKTGVLILVVVDNGLVRYLFNKYGVSNRS